MIIILFILNAFSALTYTDNCTDSICTANVTKDSVVGFKNRHKPKAEIITWLNEVYDTGAFGADGTFSIEIVNSESEHNKINALAQARGIRVFCETVLERVIAYNLENNFTSTQINTLQTNFAGILQALQNYRPWTALAAISVITPDALVTQEFKDELIAMFTAAGISN